MKPHLNILDVSATIGCNLSCKGCNHFSNYFAPGSKLDTDKLIEDIHTILPRLDVDRVSVIGGEPLLNPRCKEILDACIESSEKAVYLYSNAILLKDNQEWVEEVLHHPRVSLRISLHLPENSELGMSVLTNVKNFMDTSKYPSKILVTQHHNGQDRWFNSIKQLNDKIYPYEHNNIEQSFRMCSCPNSQLFNGKLWKCPNAAFLNELLYVTDQLEDDCWKPFLGGGLSVDCSDEDLFEFCNRSNKAEQICNMCTSKPLRFNAALQVNHKKKVITSQ
jgi:organic radical activating enzyme